MVCEICKEKQATVHITRIINDEKEEMHLCEECAKKIQGLNMDIDLNGDFNINEPFTFQSILSGIMDYMHNSTANSIGHYEEPVCKNCGTTYTEFKQKGLLGCSECYKNFSTTMNSVIKRVQSSSEHVGKIPITSGKNIMKRKTLLKLKEKLQKAIAIEEYEKAAEIRDKIREIEKEN
ncbi:UvrB/UvrC motif-containing protein [Haloimpatiens sp. FM7330]|uniref:UvrB/UvrC motif-containing protein n=1 Tax=Haloimpatiens sp. FM7330 TaxID=3298610 RepID=UPI00363CBEC8